jgi:predicted GTPase
MSRWRIIVMVFLIGAPLLVMAGLGTYFVWREGWALWVWWPLTGLMVLGYVLGWHWQRQQKLLKPADFIPPLRWTDRDWGAWKLVEARAQTVPRIPPEKLIDFQFYFDTGREMATELARFYHPGAADPVGNLTLPEILAVIELAAHDLSALVNDYVPASHLLTVNNWWQAKQATEWYQAFNNVVWVVRAIFSPVNTALSYATAQAGMARPWQLMQQDVIVWFYTHYLHRLGAYLIDLNGGRLRVGAKRYRELVRGEISGDTLPPQAPLPGKEPAERVKQVTLLILGQVKAGKSSFINALLGERRAATDVVPATNAVCRYELQPKDIPTRLVLLDSAGYGHAGPKEDEVRATEEAARQADLLLLVLHANNPARQADLDMLQRLRSWYAGHPELRMPPVLGIMTHIDLLSPALEWAPPYNWTEPTRPKEETIKEAWEAIKEQLGDHLVGIVPVCTAAGKVYGIEEWFLPTLIELMDEAHAVALLRCLRAEADMGRVRKVFQQLLSAGKEAAQVLLQEPTPPNVVRQSRN